jgi:hypothetical protein
MATTTRNVERCRERADACRRLAAVAVSSELRESYQRLAQAHEMLAQSVHQLDRVEHWFASGQALPAPH